MSEQTETPEVADESAVAAMLLRNLDEWIVEAPTDQIDPREPMLLCLVDSDEERWGITVFPGWTMAMTLLRDPVKAVAALHKSTHRDAATALDILPDKTVAIVYLMPREKTGYQSAIWALTNEEGGSLVRTPDDVTTGAIVPGDNEAIDAISDYMGCLRSAVMFAQAFGTDVAKMLMSGDHDD